ncbi:hypothetical protein [Tenacibaculum soleae]|uniref:hypothetical protein n=1 Tax=Tenacibaculum soleae TaxID=447689 RepID=UPI00230192FE|nr:hypothetical protein [Tenacibaculum soleae]
MNLKILDLSVVMTYSFFQKKTMFRYMLHVQFKNETPYYIHLDKSCLKRMFNKFKFSSMIISDKDLRYRIYKPK